jgi:gamma-glutamylcyclotransferase (GGCT)/AIG2-like uncharacterized protein YtfP
VRDRGPLPFFVYGTLRPGEHNHALFLRGRTAREEPARLEGALLYDGPGYPYVIEAPDVVGAPGAVAGELVTAPPEEYHELLTVLDALEQYYGPGDPRNVYERLVHDVRRLADSTTVRAWVYVAARGRADDLRLHGRRIPGGDWTGRAVCPSADPPGPDTSST